MDLDRLHMLSELKFRKSESALAQLVQRENALRAELDRLRELVYETRAQPPEHREIRAIGADIVWLKWVGQAQRHLNIELAQVLALKEGHMARHKRAHGEQVVSERLADDAREARRQNKRAAQLKSAIDFAQFR